jgi:oxygen-dependent protoporphyrinogen oxidase
MLAFAMEPFRRSRPPEGDESVAAFFERRFGAGAARTASAFVHGIYAADPAKLSLRSAFGILHAAEKKAGSVVLGMLRGPRAKTEVDAEMAAWAAIGPLGKQREGWNMYALRGGMGQLIAALEDKARAAGVEVRRARVLRLNPDARVNIETSYGPLRVDHVVAALPPRRLERVLASPLPHLLANPSTTVGVVNVVLPLPPKDVRPNGFGYLIPRGGNNPEGALGVVFDSTALPGTDEGGPGDEADGHARRAALEQLRRRA